MHRSRISSRVNNAENTQDKHIKGYQGLSGVISSPVYANIIPVTSAPAEYTPNATCHV